MEEKILNVFEFFKKDVDDDSFTTMRYFETDFLEYDYSHAAIDEARNKLAKMMKEYLREKHPGKYVLSNSDEWIYVLSVEEAQKRHMLYISENTIGGPEEEMDWEY